MPDSTTTITDLRRRVADFVAARRWEQYHSPKNLAMSLAIETAELMEHFQWLTTDESRAVAADPAKLAEVADELADVVTYALAMANQLGLDLSTAIYAKIAKNEQKYPVDEYRGRYGADDPKPADKTGDGSEPIQPRIIDNA